ncbi:MAG: aminodeoxychorismate synthase component I [Opitutaceae bacterium]
MRVLEIADPPSLDVLIERFGARDLPFILDSSQFNDGLGQWSFFGADPFDVVSHTSTISPAVTEGLSLLRERLAPHRIERRDCTIPFVGGAVGFISYDYGRQIEAIAESTEDDRSVPDLWFGLYDGIAAFNHETGVLHLLALGIRASESAVIDELQAIVAGERMPTGESSAQTPVFGEWVWNMSREAFEEKVDKVRDYIASGDIYQVNLSQRARCPFEGDSLELFQALRQGNPSPYGAFINAGDLQIISTSPEQFLRKRGRSVETRPIKGTRPRGATPEEDLQNAAALRASEKERAELLMIVDLERNDLGRVAEFGSVRVENLYHLEHYKRVMHQTAQVKALLATPYDVFDCIRALFPGGSITGAPKVRAMEVIEELEPTRRGVYCGSVGYIGFDGDAELNIAIRSLQVKNGYVDYQVGGGIVWDSDPASEYQETLDKGRAIRETLDQLC